jgi:hypothetical protein
MSQVPPTADRGPYRLTPTPDEHASQSRRLILSAAAQVAPGRAIVLGAGRCDEIPLAELAHQFGHLVLNDSEQPLLDEALARENLPPEVRKKIQLDVRDLTGVTDSLLEKCAEQLAAAPDEPAAINSLIQVIEAAALSPAIGSPQYDLVVASCVLSQLHVALVQQAVELFGRQFAGREEILRGDPRWSMAVYQFARRVEERFIDQLWAMLARGGRIYLSESVQMCFIEPTSDGQWQTDGTLRMLRTKDLRDYLDRRFVIEAADRWHWVFWPATEGEKGRLYDVQALIVASR